MLNRVNKELGVMWRDLGKNSPQRIQYQTLSKQEKAQYSEAMKAYVAPSGFAKVAIATRVLRPRSSYMYFYKDKLAEVKLVSPASRN